jgi:flagellar hook-basal body complex protein FliE
MPSVDHHPLRLALPLTSRLLAGRSMEQLAAGAMQNPGGAHSVDFGSLLGQGVAEVNSLQNQSAESIEQLLTGGDVQPAEVFASVQKADMAFRMLLQVRNKLMQAYEEVNAIRI